MSVSSLESLPEFEFELEDEWAGELEPEDEFEHESDSEIESEEFFRRLAGLAARAAQNPALRRVGLAAARHALAGLPRLGAAVGAPGSAWSDLGARAGQALSSHLSRQLPARELEGEFEYEDEYEGEPEINPIRRVYPAALMEHLGRAAAETEYEEEAEAFVGAMVPLTVQLVPRVAPAIMRATPQLIRGAANVTRMLRASPATRPLVRAVPAIVTQTVRSIGRQVAAGRPVSAQAAAQTLARQTARTLSSPRQCVRAYRRSRVLDRRFHSAVPRSAGRI